MSGEGYSAELYVMSSDGSAQTRVTRAGGLNHQARWSPDGSSIVFRRAPCEFNCIPHIFKIAPDGTALTQLTFETNGSDRTPDWAPSGGRIVFARDVGGYHFFTMNPDGNDVTMIPGQHLDPAWSPDGLKLAFGFPGVGHMNVDGSEARPINTSGGEKPDLQPLVPGPRRSDYKNGPAFCRAERDYLGEQDFNAQYGSFGQCVSAKS